MFTDCSASGECYFRLRPDVQTKLVAISVALHLLYFGSNGCSLYLDNYKGQVIKYKELVAGGESWIPEKGNSKLWGQFQ